MTAKEYLLQAHYLDERITSKTQQIAALNEHPHFLICLRVLVVVVPGWKNVLLK